MSAEADQARDIASSGLSRVSVLLANPEFRWFLEECLATKRAEAERALKNRKSSPEERTAALDRYMAFEEVANWPAEQRAVFQKALGHAVT